MVVWDKICRPKKVGGLGLRKIELLNSAFLSKLTWELFYIKPLIRTSACKISNWCQFLLSQPKRIDSQFWKCILNNRHQFRKGIRWKVGNSQNINFWFDNWCANDSLANLLGLLDYSFINTSFSVRFHRKKQRMGHFQSYPTCWLNPSVNDCF